MRRTATTANAILGLLCLRSEWAIYDVTKQLRRNMRFFWPRAESGIYDQAKWLVRQGWARARRRIAPGGTQARSIYSITPAGKRVVRQWLRTQPQPMALECEPLLRIFLADFSTAKQLDAALAQVRADADAILATGRVVGEEYLAGTAPFQSQLHVRGLVFDFLWSHATMMRDWADRTEGVIRRWPGETKLQKDKAALARIRTRLKHPSMKDLPIHRRPSGPEPPKRRSAGQS